MVFPCFPPSLYTVAIRFIWKERERESRTVYTKTTVSDHGIEPPKALASTFIVLHI